MFTGWLDTVRPLPASLPTDWALLLTSPPYFCWPCPSCLISQDPYYPRVQKLKQWGNRDMQVFGTWPSLALHPHSVWLFHLGCGTGGQCEPRGSVIQGPVPVGWTDPFPRQVPGGPGTPSTWEPVPVGGWSRVQAACVHVPFVKDSGKSRP